VGLFDFLRRKDENAIPEPGTPEFEAAVQGSAIPDGKSVSMGEGGWQSADAVRQALAQAGVEDTSAIDVDIDVQHTSQTVDLTGTDARDKIQDVLRENGIDPDKQGQTIDASTVPGLQEAIFSALGDAGVQIPGAGGFGGGVGAPQQDPIAVVEALAAKRDAGEITDAEFEAQKQRLLGS
jgi:hypothetical protein